MPQTSKDQLNTFKSLVNVEGISIPTASDIIEKEGKIELVSVQDNTHNQSTFVEKITSYSMFSFSPEAFAKVEVDGSLKSRGDINIQSYASNGAVSKINSKGEKSFGSNNKLSIVKSEISFSGNAVAGGNITLEATADNENTCSTLNVKDFGLSILGGSIAAFPLNVNVDVLFSKTKSKVDVKQGSILDAKLALKIDAITNASQQQGTKTAVSVSKNVQEKSKLGRYLPSGASVYAEADSESIVNFDGKAISRAESLDEEEASISLRSESNSEIDISATAKTSKSISPTQISLAIGKHTNKATLTIGEHASFETKQDVEIVSETNSENYVEAASKGNRTEYVIPAVGISLFNSDSIVNIEKTNINLDEQEDSFTIKAINNILADELYAEAGITSSYAWEDAASQAKDAVISKLMDKLKINAALEWLFGPDTNPAIPKPKPLFNLTGAVAYGGGVHNSKINVKPGAKLITSGDLILDSKTYIHDTKYDATSYNYPETEDEDNPSAKAGLGFAVLVSNYDYNSKITFDDSTTSAKTQFVGNSVTINSSVEQPYKRVEVLIDAVKKAALKLKDFFTKDEHKEICDEIANAASKMSTSNSSIFSNILTMVLKLKDLLLKETIGEDSMIKRLMAVLENALAFKDYTNYLNYTVSSYVNSSEGDTKLDFAGSVFVGSNKAKSNLFIGKNTVINSQGDGDDRNISLNSKTDITNTAMAGGVPLIAQNIGGEEAVSIGGSAIIHTNDSVSELLIADSAKIGSENTEKLSITSDNKFKPIDIIVGASSASKGFNIMASVITGDSKANVLIDNSVNLAADTLKLYAYNNTSATNTVGSIMLTDKVGVGVGAAVTSLTKEAKIIYD
ncbi:MAG: hypothetical protein II567_14165, partial [Candidatus Riflebacteria bacterium]|nr:hypothetical protein [Candidatus Riflebacteria bacterium]